MSQNRPSLRALAQLLPSGALGLSAGLAAADAAATTAPEPRNGKRPVAERLEALRTDVSEAIEQHRRDGEPFVAVDPEQLLAWWGNGGWRNGGWRNWGNGGWGNWHNGWHNW
jgi:rSAM-associated Gly-rich repeat protein